MIKWEILALLCKLAVNVHIFTYIRPLKFYIAKIPLHRPKNLKYKVWSKFGKKNDLQNFSHGIVEQLLKYCSNNGTLVIIGLKRNNINRVLSK